MYKSLNETVKNIIKDTKNVETNPAKKYAQDNYFDSQPTAGTGTIHTIMTTSAENSRIQADKLHKHLLKSGYSIVPDSEFIGDNNTNISYKHPKLHGVHMSYSNLGMRNGRHGVSFTTST